MAQLVNPKLEIVIFGSYETFAIDNVDIDFDITKDLDEEPNECELTIYNLKEGTRGKLISAADESAPIHVRATPAKKTSLTTMFKGELDTCKSMKMHPGHETVLHSLSQQLNHRARYIEKEYAKGTRYREILDDLIEAVGLPTGEIDLWFVDEAGASRWMDGTIGLSETYTGAAFPLLKRFCFDAGYKCYILDGHINITVAHPWDRAWKRPNVIEIPDDILLGTPEPTQHDDALIVQQQTIVESLGYDVFEKASKKKKKKKRVKVPLKKGQSIYVNMPEPEPYSDDYSEYETVNTQVSGMDFRCILQPGINPDTIVSTPRLPNRLFRVIEVNHHGENERFDDWATDLVTYEYEDDTGELAV